eukprot:jgi/Chrzof1/11350/Cz05g33110.t1
MAVTTNAMGTQQAEPSVREGPAVSSDRSSNTDHKEANDDCPWCLYMKVGPCRDVFTVWQTCVDSVMDIGADHSGRRAAVDKCTDVTKPLVECMMQHPEYYAPQMESMTPADASQLPVQQQYEQQQQQPHRQQHTSSQASEYHGDTRIPSTADRSHGSKEPSTIRQHASMTPAAV